MNCLARASFTIWLLLTGILTPTKVSFCLPSAPREVPVSMTTESAAKFDTLRTIYFNVAGKKNDPSDGMKGLSELFPADVSETPANTSISSEATCTPPSLLHSLEEKALYTSYCASFIAFAARDSLWPLKKLNLAKRSLVLLDSAIATAPESLEVRALRLAVTHHLPFFFDRSEQAANDLQLLKSELDKCQSNNIDSGDNHSCQLDQRIVALLDFLH